MSTDDYYVLLGVSAQASTHEIKEAYRRKALEHHPDRNRDNPAAVEAMKRVNEAYAVLSNPSKRREYDALRLQFGPGAQSRYRSSHSNEDIFSGSDINSVFDEMARAFGVRGVDEIFRDVYGQSYRGFEFKRPGVRVRVFGFGRSPGKPDAGASGTGLFGKIVRRALRGAHRPHPPVDGSDIHDRIWITARLAESGGPYAYLLRQGSKKLIVRVPPGIREGQRIRLSGIGETGRHGGKNGDLFLEVRFQKPVFRRMTDAALSLWARAKNRFCCLTG
jgi:curved DNA-binding protein